MQIGKAKDYFENGLIVGFTARRAEMMPGWHLTFNLRSGSFESLETKLGQLRVFASLDTLVGVIESVGGKVDCLKVVG